jgi:uncharacterized membrane protein HdeD (DUF308 family)
MDKNIQSKFGPYTFITGIMFVVLGTAGILLPVLMSLGAVIFSAWLLFLGGVMWGIHTYHHDAKSIMSWIKSALLVGVSVLMMSYPMSSIEALGLLLALYLLLDAFGSFVLAHSIHPSKGWGWMSFNAVTSLLLGSLFLFGWPATSLYLVGLYVGISLLVDGGALIAIGWALRK